VYPDPSSEEGSGSGSTAFSLPSPLSLGCSG